MRHGALSRCLLVALALVPIAPAPSSSTSRRSGASSVGAGRSASCAVLERGGLACWGKRPLTAQTERALNVAGISNAESVSLSAGGGHGCAVTRKKRVMCFGNGHVGQLGNGGTGDAVIAVEVVDLLDVIAVSCGRQHTCAVKKRGGVACWGGSSDGKPRLGDGSSSASSRPVEVLGIHAAVAVSCGAEHCCALHASGRASCWGEGQGGRLGSGSNISQPKPARVAGLEDVVSLSCGEVRSCAARVDGSVLCWGGGEAMEAVAGLADAVLVSCGISLSCAVRADGTVACWGMSRNELKPVAGISDAIALACGRGHCCAARELGGVACWGEGDQGQLGGAAADAVAGELAAVEVPGVSVGASAVQLGPAGTPEAAELSLELDISAAARALREASAKETKAEEEVAIDHTGAKPAGEEEQEEEDEARKLSDDVPPTPLPTQEATILPTPKPTQDEDVELLEPNRSEVEIKFEENANVTRDMIYIWNVSDNITAEEEFDVNMSNELNATPMHELEVLPFNEDNAANVSVSFALEQELVLDPIVEVEVQPPDVNVSNEANFTGLPPVDVELFGELNGVQVNVSNVTEPLADAEEVEEALLGLGNLANEANATTARIFRLRGAAEVNVTPAALNVSAVEEAIPDADTAFPFVAEENVTNVSNEVAMASARLVEVPEPSENEGNVTNATEAPTRLEHLSADLVDNKTIAQVAAVTIVDLILEVHPANFSLPAFLAAVAEAANLDPALVEMQEVTYVIRIYYWLPFAIPADTARTAVAAIFDVPVDAVRVEISVAGLLVGEAGGVDYGGRRLSGAQLMAEVRVIDLTKMQAILEAVAGSQSLLSQALSAANRTIALSLLGDAQVLTHVQVQLNHPPGHTPLITAQDIAAFEQVLSAKLGFRAEVEAVRYIVEDTLNPELELFGTFILNVTNATGFSRDPGVPGALQAGIASAFGIHVTKAVVDSVMPYVPGLLSAYLDLGDGDTEKWELVEVRYRILLPRYLALVLAGKVFADTVHYEKNLLDAFRDGILDSLAAAAAAGLLQGSYAVEFISASVLNFVPPEVTTLPETILGNFSNVTICGDGKRMNEERYKGRCDDGNLVDGDGCDSDCNVEPGWYCPAEGGLPCKYVCGDGRLALPVEECDDGNTVPLDGCDGNCTVEEGWYCPMGQACHTICGDGLLGQGGEECEDGNLEPYDGCSEDCRVEQGRCVFQAADLCFGAWVVRPNVSEFEFCHGYRCVLAECCTNLRREHMLPADVRLEGWKCPPGGDGSCYTVCGDGLREGPEAGAGRCDDGNTEAQDGCDGACMVEPGWYCEEEGRPCETRCGDGFVGRPVETCDDGNLEPFDGCDASCHLELGRCAQQAASLCVGGWAPRWDVGDEIFCNATRCTLAECCLPDLGACDAGVGAAHASQVRCVDGFGRRTDWQPPAPDACSSHRCPAGWNPRPAASAASCANASAALRGQCLLAACCEARGATCTCAAARCCAPPLLAPAFLDAGSGGASGLAGLDLTEPLALPSLLGESRPRWYFYLSTGAVALDSLLASLQKSADLFGHWPPIFKGYRIEVPSPERLVEVLAAAPTSPALVNVGLSPKVWHSFPAAPEVPKHALLEVEEVFTVAHGDSVLQRRLLRNGMPCCLVEDSGPGDSANDFGSRVPNYLWTQPTDIVRLVSATGHFGEAYGPAKVLRDSGRLEEAAVEVPSNFSAAAAVDVGSVAVNSSGAYELRFESGDGGDYWRAADVTDFTAQEVTFELLAPLALAGVRTKFPAGQDGGAFDRFDVASSRDGSNWALALRGRGDAVGCCDFQEHSFPERTGRFWRLTIRSTHGGARPYLQYVEFLARQPGPGSGPARALANVPAAAAGATFFALGAGAGSAGLGASDSEPPLAAGGEFAVVSQVPAVLFLLAIDGDRPRGGLPGRYRSGFEGLGFEVVPSEEFMLMPWGLPMTCWKRDLLAGERIDVPHTAELYGSVALRAL